MFIPVLNGDRQPGTVAGTAGGPPDAPIVYSGDGSTQVPGITATADNVVIQGFVSDGADSTSGTAGRTSELPGPEVALVGKGNKAFALGKNATGTVVRDNRIGVRVRARGRFRPSLGPAGLPGPSRPVTVTSPSNRPTT
jgi:hypothetical protein